MLDVAGDVLRVVRRAKSDAKQSMKAPVATTTVRDSAERIAALRLAATDVAAAGSIRDLNLAEATGEATEPAIDVVLADEPT